ncbi:MAG: hypothetical protein WCG25_03810 [bacterium]
MAFSFLLSLPYISKIIFAKPSFGLRFILYILLDTFSFQSSAFIILSIISFNAGCCSNAL